MNSTLEKLATEFDRNAELAKAVVAEKPLLRAVGWREGYQEGMRAAASICRIEMNQHPIIEEESISG